jgi:hypothetical protein
VLSIASTTFCVSALSTMLVRFNYYAWYGSATKELLDASLFQIEEGHLSGSAKVF